MDDKLRILLCEDDENLGMLLREYLQAKGYNADLFPDGEVGFKAFLKSKYDLYKPVNASGISDGDDQEDKPLAPIISFNVREG
jgi:CheY-like chemotaxis protein